MTRPGNWQPDGRTEAREALIAARRRYIEEITEFRREFRHALTASEREALDAFLAAEKALWVSLLPEDQDYD